MKFLNSDLVEKWIQQELQRDTESESQHEGGGSPQVDSQSQYEDGSSQADSQSQYEDGSSLADSQSQCADGSALPIPCLNMKKAVRKLNPQSLEQLMRQEMSWQTVMRQKHIRNLLIPLVGLKLSLYMGYLITKMAPKVFAVANTIMAAPPNFTPTSTYTLSMTDGQLKGVILQDGVVDVRKEMEELAIEFAATKLEKTSVSIWNTLHDKYLREYPDHVIQMMKRKQVINKVENVRAKLFKDELSKLEIPPLSMIDSRQFLQYKNNGLGSDNVDRYIIWGVLSKEFPGVNVVGCYFHFKQAIRKKLIDLKVNQPDITFILGPLVIELLCIVKESEVRGVALQFAKLQCRNLSTPMNIINDFWKYFEKTWFGLYDISTWNISRLEGQVLVNRTNNPLESYNRKLNKGFKGHPRMVDLISLLKTHVHEYEGLLRAIADGNARAPFHAPPQKVSITLPIEYTEFRARASAPIVVQDLTLPETAPTAKQVRVRKVRAKAKQKK
ncbi:hypothetical protein MIR68_009476 [Amoeboaphelidium protococcarum]|nr:hypothetical protein MIR68_009476 [Amoeboaphelidium protococcarum]